MSMLSKAHTALVVRVRAAPIQTQEDLDWAGEMSAEIGLALKHLAKKHKAEKEPYLEGGRAVDAKYREPRKLLEACDEELKKKVAALRALQREAETEARAEVRSAGAAASADTLALAHGAGALTMPSHMRETSELLWEVEDESRVPAEYKRTSAELVEAEIKRSKGACKIPGIRVWREFDVARKGVVRK